jgi:hypothetical protein
MVSTHQAAGSTPAGGAVGQSTTRQEDEVPQYCDDEPLVPLTLCWTLVTLAQSIDTKLEIIREVYGTDRVSITRDFKTDAKHTSMVSGSPQFEPHRLWWQLIDLGANRFMAPTKCPVRTRRDSRPSTCSASIRNTSDSKMVSRRRTSTFPVSASRSAACPDSTRPTRSAVLTAPSPCAWVGKAARIRITQSRCASRDALTPRHEGRCARRYQTVELPFRTWWPPASRDDRADSVALHEHGAHSHSRAQVRCSIELTVHELDGHVTWRGGGAVL